MEQYCKEVLKVVVAQICQTVGWHRIQSSPLDVMADILSRYIKQMAVITHRYSEHFGMTQPNLDHVALMMRDMHINTHEIEEYINWVEPVPCIFSVPKLPVSKESQLNFLKPGSREVVTRPVHVHEHLPPMYPELEAEESSPIIANAIESPSMTTIMSPTLSKVSTISSDLSDGENVFKRPGDPISDNHIAKRPKLSFGEEGRPTREISSVMMTSSGFLSPAREGKLPESRTPQNLNETQVQSSQYPTVPPELRIEKKIKKINIDSVKRKEQFKPSDMFRPDNKIANDINNKIKKLSVMKENAKLKPFKSKPGFSIPNTSIEIVGKGITNLAAVQKQIPSETKIQKVHNLVTKPIKIEDPPIPTITSQPEPGVTIIEIDDQGVRKLSNEPDKVKLNIFKKISSKLKDDKNDKSEKGDKKSDNHFDLAAAASSRDIHAVDIIPINEPIGKVKNEIKREPEKSKTPEITIKEEPIYPNALPLNRDQTSISILKQLYDLDLSPPGTPLTPKTPELQIPPQTPPKKFEKEKKKRKERTKKIKNHKLKIPKIEQMSPRLSKFDNDSSPQFFDNQRPKTPDDPITITTKTEASPGLIPPIFSMFPSGPGLIPKPMYPPFLPRGMGKHGFGQPPLLISNSLMTVTPTVAPVIKTEPPSLSITPANENKKALANHININKVIKEEPIDSADIVMVKVEKKSKEHKKEKKDKLEKKIRKKKEKKEKKKGKDKAEKKAEKIKVKKEKKEKHKDKQTEAALPKLIMKLGVQQQRETTPDGSQVTRKITIKSVLKKSEDEIIGSNEREMSPELARISALVTRPPKTSKTNTTVSSSGSGQSVVLASSFSNNSMQLSPNATDVSLHVKLKKSMFKSKKLKSTDLLMRRAADMIDEVDTSDEIEQNRAMIMSTNPSPHPAQQMPTKEAFYFDKDGNKVWFCPACGRQDDGSPMIGCDDCDAWYHWVCVGIQVPPDDNEDWYCKICISKKQENFQTDRKKKRRKREKKEH